MRVAFLSSDKARENLLADAFLNGARRHGHATEVHALQPEPFVGNYDVACMVGVKSRALFEAHRKAGVPVIYLDKGYSRHKRPDMAGWEFWRFSINAHHPTQRLAALDMPADRFAALGLQVMPWRKAPKARHIVLAGSSAKYHAFYGMKEPNAWAAKTVLELRRHTGRELIYRPKPTWRDARAVPGASFSGPNGRPLGDDLAACWALVTHGSNACFEAVLAGIPCVILGDGVAMPISTVSLAEIEEPRLATEPERSRWLANIGYFQWTQAEMHTGQAWDFIGREIHA